MGTVSIVKYEDNRDSVNQAINLADAFSGLKENDTVFLKPNIVGWSRLVPMPPWGMITTSRVMEDVVKALKDHGAGRIIIAEGTITHDPNDRETPAHAFETLGYNAMAKKYGVEIYNCFEREFSEVDLGDGVILNFSTDMLESDFVTSVPVLKTHAQTIVSIAQKNLKGCLDMESRKKCHAPSMDKDLDYHVAKLADILPNSCAIVDGIYTLERGPAYTGKARRMDVILASSDILAADIAGAAVLGFEASEIPHIKKACDAKGIEPAISSIEVKGEKLEDVASPHGWDFPYNEENTVPLHMQKAGIEGLIFPKFDLSLCSYCSGLIGLIQMAIGMSYKGKPFDKVEVLTGKMQTPTPDMNHTILLGKCQVKLNKEHPDIADHIKVPGCPPDINRIADALRDAGIDVDQSMFDNFEFAPALFMKRYENKPEFSQDFFRVE